MSKASFVVHVGVEIEYDESRFTPEFMENFRENFHPFETIEEHLEHIAECYARGLIGANGFLEGYGKLSDLDIRIEPTGCEVEEE